MTTQTTSERTDNLPAKVTSFVGRTRELAAITQALDAHRLVTLRGPGGVGKTRLALKAATDVRDAYGQQAWLVELSALSDPDLVAVEVARTLGLPDEGAGDLLEVLARQLAESELLLVLDNCEHLSGACARLAKALLAGSPDLRILATSREPLGAAGEHVIVISPLDAATPQSDAVELLLDRARSAVPGYALTPANTDAVIRLCQRLDGIPLAIELAAVRLRSMSAAEIADLLDDRFRILGTVRTANDRHRTLRAAVEWSYDLCTPEEQRAWTHLSVFAGVFTPDAADAVAGPGTSDVLPRLAEKSIITGPGDGQADGGGTYRLLDTMREFGVEMLADQDRAAARHRHRDYFLDLAERAATQAAGRGQVGWMAWIRMKSDSLRAALNYSFTTPGEDIAGTRMTLALRCYWLMLGEFREGLHWHELARMAHPGTRQNAWATYGSGVLAAQQGDLGAARRLLDQASGLAAGLADSELAAYVADAQGSVAFYAGDNEAAARLFAAALARFEEHGFGDPTALVCYSRLASACMLASDLDRAIALCEECMRRCDAVGEQWARSTALWTRGAARWLSGDNDLAMADALACLATKEALGDRHTMTMCLDLVAVCLASPGASSGELTRAAALSGAGDAMWEVLDAPLQMGPAYAEIRKDAAARCRAALGDERFEAAHQHGLAMSLADASALARGEAPAGGTAGRKPLTRREREIADLVAKGLGNREIAEQLFLSKRTVDSHIEHIFAKQGFTSRAQLSSWVLGQSPNADASR